MIKPTDTIEPRIINVSGLRKNAVRHVAEYEFEGAPPFGLLFNSFEQSERFASMLLIGSRATLTPAQDTTALAEVLFSFVQKRRRWWIGSRRDGSIGILRNMGSVRLLFPIIKGLPKVKLDKANVWW